MPQEAPEHQGSSHSRDHAVLAALIGAVAVIAGAIIGVVFAHGGSGEVNPQTSGSATAQADHLAKPALQTPGPKITPHSGPPTNTATAAVSSMTLSCSLSQQRLRPGMTVQLTYHVDSPVIRQAGLGAGLYDAQGNDDSNGDGDVDSIALHQGWNSLSRPVTIPANLQPGQYELDAEIWPANEIGQNGVNDLIDATCTYFKVP